MDGRGNDMTEAFEALLASMREGDAGKVGEAWKALEYRLFAARVPTPDEYRAMVAAPQWTLHGPGEPPKPGLYLRYGRSPQGFGLGFLGACFHCAGACPPDAEEGWGWLHGPLPPPPGYCDAPVAGRSGP